MSAAYRGAPRPWRSFDASQPNRVAAACRLIGALTADEWQPWARLVAVVADATQLQPKTVENLLYGMCGKTGDLERRGDYSRSDDTRAAKVHPARRSQ